MRSFQLIKQIFGAKHQSFAPLKKQLNFCYTVDKNIEIVEKIMIMIMATTTAIVLLLLSKMSAVGKLRNMLRRVLMNTVIYLRN